MKGSASGSPVHFGRLWQIRGCAMSAGRGRPGLPGQDGHQGPELRWRQAVKSDRLLAVAALPISTSQALYGFLLRLLFCRSELRQDLLKRIFFFSHHRQPRDTSLFVTAVVHNLIGNWCGC